ncbi:MAG TPA: amidohydrolase family protein [Candidatus Limnocylindria bacterium]
MEPAPTADLIVAGGTVIAPSGSRHADVAIANGRITAVADGLRADGARVIDARGLVVLPGVIDVHTHLRLPNNEHPHRFGRDTLAAARGGTTTVLTFNNPGTGISDAGAASPLHGLEEFRDRTDGQSAIDYGLSAVLSGQQRDPIRELPSLIEAGVPTFKAFMVYDFRLADADLEAAMRTAARHGGMLQVHCEEPSIIDHLVSEALRANQTSCRHHALTRPRHAEAAATRKAIEMARRAEAPLYIVHLSCEEALDHVAEAKSRGEPVYAETCPHYLTLTDALYADPDEGEVIKRVISPPLRTPEDVDALWGGLRDGVLDVVGSDHVPDRLDTEKALPAPPFPEISNGGPGIETLLSVVHSAGVAARRITTERMVEVLSSTPARLFGLPTKGAIEVGRDADLVLLEPGAQRTIRQADLSHTSDYTPYEGMLVSGAIRGVLVRGRSPGDAPGRFMERHLG